MLLEVEQAARKPLIGGLGGVVVERTDDVERELDLQNAFVQVCVRTVRMESGPCGDDMILRRADGSFRTVRVVDVGGQLVPTEGAYPKPKL